MAKRILLTEICRKGKISKENRFYDLVSDVEIEIDKEKFPGRVRFFKNDKHIFDQDSRSDTFWCRHYSYWLIFEREFDMEYDEIQSFTKSMLKKHFKIRISIPIKIIS